MNSSEKALIQWLHEHGITPSGCDGVAGDFSTCMNALGKLCREEPYRFIGVCEEILGREELPKTCVVPLLKGMIDFLLLRIRPESLSLRRPYLSSIEQEILHFVYSTLEIAPVLANQALLKAGFLRLQIFLARHSQDITALIGELMALAAHRDPESYKNGGFAFSENEFENLVSVSETSVRGMAAANAVLSAVALLKSGEAVPALLSMLLVRFAKDLHSGVRISVLRWLPFLAGADADLAWKLFDLAFQNREGSLVRAAEPFLQQQYGKAPDRVRRVLAPLKDYLPMEGEGNRWGGVISRAFLKKDVSKEAWLGDLLLFKSVRVREDAFFLLEQETRQAGFQATALSGLIHLLAHLEFTPVIMNRIEKLFQHLSNQFEKSVPLANGLIPAYRGAGAECDMKWFYRFLETLSQKTPAAACQLAESLLAYMETSDAFYRAWQGEEYLTLLINMLKKGSIPDDARQLLVKAQSIQRRSGTFSHV